MLCSGLNECEREVLNRASRDDPIKGKKTLTVSKSWTVC